MIERSLCTGCSACYAACPTHAIKMERDQEGFLYPMIDERLCNDCKRCESMCPVLHSKVKEEVSPKAFMVIADEQICQKSSSGGLFSLLAHNVLLNGGIVIGCAMSKDLYSARHILVDSVQELDNVRRSKYLQSEIGDVLLLTKNVLQSGRRVLFSGTPCQIAGLKRYLKKIDCSNLLTVDMICHGVPSPMVWKDYLCTLESEYKSKATRLSFRDKTEGWQNYSLKCSFENGQVYRKKVGEDMYLRGFVADLYLRPSCYNCSIKSNRYASDITMGDFWGIKEFYPEIQAQNGVSLAITHTETGDRALERLNNCYITEVPIEMALKHNVSYYHSAQFNPLRSYTIKNVLDHGTKKTLPKVCGTNLIARIRRKWFSLVSLMQRTWCKH